MTSEERKDAARYLPNLWHSLVQVIIQSRLGEKTYTVSKSPAKGSSMFNLEIKQYEEVTQHVKRFIGNQAITLTSDNCLSIEILLRTKEESEMVLEIWTLSIEENLDSSSPKICQLVTDRMSVLLKSAICVSRITPAYGLSFRQSSETFVILYKLYTKKPEYSSLGEKPVQVRVGQANVQSAYLSIHLAYRTDLTFPSSKRRTINDQNQMMLKSDHFKVDSSPKHFRKASERVTDSSDTTLTSDESQDASKLPFNSPTDLHFSSRSRTSSESSNRAPQFYLSTEKIYAPFATNKTTSLEEYSMADDIPFSNLMVSTAPDRQDIMAHMKTPKERRESESEAEAQAAKAAKVCEKPQMNSSDQSNKSFSSNATKEDNDYVVVDLKTPFVGTDTNDMELTSIFKEWQSAPPLRMFSDLTEDVPLEDSLCLDDQLKCFENCADEYEDLVKSLNLDDQSSQELG